MTSNWEQGKSGLFTPADILSPTDGLPIPSTEAPIFQFLLGNLTTEWSMKNWETVWNSRIYGDVSNVWAVTMEGIDILKAEGTANTSKGIIVSQMMGRGLSLARTACWAMAVGSPMDALACYRMIYDRALTLQFLDKNGQYQEFERYCWAEAYFWLSDAASLQLWRTQATQQEIQSHKDRQTKIRQKYFGGLVPKKPGTYWDPPKSEELVEGFSLHPLGLPEPKNSELLKAMKRLYELGSKAVHPRIGDMVETEDLGWSADSKECMDLILMALISLTTFGLSRYSKTESLARKIAALAVSHSKRT